MNDAEVIRGGRGVWSATPWNYSSARFMMLQADGTGRLIYGYGQTIYAIILCRWEAPSPGLLQLTYLESPPRWAPVQRVLAARRWGGS